MEISDEEEIVVKADSKQILPTRTKSLVPRKLNCTYCCRSFRSQNEYCNHMKVHHSHSEEV